MPLEITPICAEYVRELTRIFFEAFKDIQERHRFPVDLPNMELARGIMEMIVGKRDIYGVAAVLDGKIVGSNFAHIEDAVSYIGPITVDTSQQGRGVGRALMQHIIEWSLKNHGPMVRLVQEGFNMQSLSLYTSLGFTVVEPLVMMEVQPGERDDPTIRPLVLEDLGVCDSLCQRILKVSRKNELAFMIEHGVRSGFVPYGRFLSGTLVAYVIPGCYGYGVGESSENFLATVVHAARHVPPHAHQLLIPIRNGELFRQALQLGMHCLKPGTLMVLGPYEQPASPGAAWTPSLGY
jgi:GNAT superfamily N-acetyltransferase